LLWVGRATEVALEHFFATGATTPFLEWRDDEAD
jgi:hypothetical protein